MARDIERRRPKNIGGPPLPMKHDDERVEQWDDWAEDSYARAVFYLDKARGCYMDAYLKPYGISSSEVAVLTYLGEGHDGDTQSVIADVVGVDPATVTRAAQKLERLGYLTRRVSSRDPRALHLDLTEEGWALAEPIQAISSAWTNEITAHLSPKRRGEMLRALHRITVRAQAACLSAKEAAGRARGAGR